MRNPKTRSRECAPEAKTMATSLHRTVSWDLPEHFLSEQGYPVDALQIAGQSVPIAVISAVVGVIYALIFDQILKRRLASKAAKEDK